MNRKFDGLYRFGIRVLLVTGVILAIYLMVKYLIPFFAPFVIALIIAMINEPVVKLLVKVKVPRKLAAVISLLITTSVLVVVVTLGIIKIYGELTALQGNVTDYVTDASDKITNYFNQLSNYYKNLPKEISDAVNEGIKSFAPQVKSLVSGTVTYLINTLRSVPSIAIFIIMTFLATYFISSDMHKIKHFLKKQIPEQWRERFEGLKTDTFSAMLGYFKALLMLMIFTFFEVTIGLFIIGSFVTKVDYILVMALLVALSDAIPVLGTGIVMVPWITWNLLTGNLPMALGLIVIYVTGVTIRQIIEPKLVGDQIGLHPLPTLLAIFIGLEIFGVLGFFLGPITVIILKSIQNSGIIKIWNE